MEQQKNKPVVPTAEAIDEERNRLKKQSQFVQMFINTLGILLVVAAGATLIATLVFPLLQVSGVSMEPTLDDRDVIMLVRSDDFKTGELVGMYHEGKILLKRVIGTPGDFVSIDNEGNVSVNGEVLDEPYVTGKSLGECDVEFPYQVPENAYFVLGDHRSVSVDSRSSTVGCIRNDKIIGRVFLRIWPLTKLKWIS